MGQIHLKASSTGNSRGISTIKHNYQVVKWEESKHCQLFAQKHCKSGAAAETETISCCVRTRSSNKERKEGREHILPSPSRRFERGRVPAQLQGAEERKQPVASAAPTPRLPPEAGSSASRARAPEETAYMTACLRSLLPQCIQV